VSPPLCVSLCWCAWWCWPLQRVLPLLLELVDELRLLERLANHPQQTDDREHVNTAIKAHHHATPKHKQITHATRKAPVMALADSCSKNGVSGECMNIDTSNDMPKRAGTQVRTHGAYLHPSLLVSCAVSSCISQSGRTAVSGLCSGGADNQCCLAQKEPKAGCGTAALARALTWVNMEVRQRAKGREKRGREGGCSTGTMLMHAASSIVSTAAQVLYCQSAQGQPDGDNACSPVCHRASNRDWNAYRSDCSAFVSYAYGVGAPGRVTSEFAPYKNDISFQLGSPNDLQPGDVINSTPSEHMSVLSPSSPLTAAAEGMRM
jgi:hypothetical protein